MLIFCADPASCELFWETLPLRRTPTPPMPASDKSFALAESAAEGGNERIKEMGSNRLFEDIALTRYTVLCCRGCVGYRVWGDHD